ncbi:MAG: MBL fold metallo-hydrolase [Acidobacteria bacterium]|nr:MBL fold metallo-hydrolase [Acidobacteriota bacterium]
MRELKLIAGMSAVVLVVAGLLAAARPAAEQAVTPERLAELTAIRPVPGKNGLYVIPGYDGGVTGGNVAVRVTNDGVILVDNKFPHSFAMITSEVRKVTALPIRYVLDTHHHGDHAGSNADFMAVAEVIAHRNARGNMVRNNQPGAPRVVFSRDTSVFLGGMEAQAHHFGRGHTNGDAVIYFPDLRTIHAGDLFIWGRRSDGSTLSPFMDYANGGSGLAWTATLDGVLELDFDTVIPGHGPILGRDEVQTFRDRMQTLADRMRAAVDAGVSRDDVPDHVETADLDWPFRPAALQALYDEVAADQ